MKYAVILLLATGACASDPRVAIRTVEVKVPVVVPCLESSDVPAMPGALPPLPQDANAALSLSLAQNFMWLAYGMEADSLLRTCAGLKAPLMSFAPNGPALGTAEAPFEPYLVPVSGGYQLVTKP